MQSPQPSTFLHGSGSFGPLIVILVSTLFLIGSGAGAGNLLGSSQQAMGWTGVFQGAALAFYAFIGFEDIVNVSEEVRNPEQNVPRAIPISLGIAGVVYVLVSWLATNVLSPSELASNAPLLDVVRRAQPHFPQVIFTLIALFAVLNTALLNFVTASRLLFGMSREGLLPAWLGNYIHNENSYRTLLVILPIAIFLFQGHCNS